MENISYQIKLARLVFKTLTFHKFCNWLKVNLSFYFKKTWGMPYSFSIEPTTSCNLRCPQCPSGLRSFDRPTGHLELNSFNNYLKEFSPNAMNMTLYFQGEPYLNPQFFDMVELAKKERIFVTTSTNAHYLSQENSEKTVKSGLDRLIVSIDGTTQEVYEKYRVGGQLDKALEGVKNLVEAKKKFNSIHPLIELQFIVFGTNEHQISDIVTLSKNLNVDILRLKTGQIYDFEHGSDLIPENTKYSRYKKLDDGKFALKNELKNECWRMWHSNVVTWDGKVVPCCFDKDAEIILGDLNQKSLSEIWKDKPYQNFRSGILKNRQAIKICQNCSEGGKVWN